MTKNIILATFLVTGLLFQLRYPQLVQKAKLRNSIFCQFVFLPKEMQFLCYCLTLFVFINLTSFAFYLPSLADFNFVLSFTLTFSLSSMSPFVSKSHSRSIFFIFVLSEVKLLIFADAWIRTAELQYQKQRALPTESRPLPKQGSFYVWFFFQSFSQQLFLSVLLLSLFNTFSLFIRFIVFYVLQFQYIITRCRHQVMPPSFQLILSHTFSISLSDRNKISLCVRSRCESFPTKVGLQKINTK